MKYLKLIIPILFLLGCGQKKNIKWKIGDEIVTGQVIQDSILHGMIHYDNVENGTSRYSVFKNGIQEGPSVSFDKSGRKIDSSYMVNGRREGFLHIYYRGSNKVRTRLFFGDGLRIGHEYSYNEKGKIIDYSFLDFNETPLYRERTDSSGKIFFRGSLINATVNHIESYGSSFDELLLFLPDSPSGKVTYDLIIVDTITNKRRIIKSFTPDDCYIKYKLPRIQSFEKYCIAVNQFNYENNKYNSEFFDIKAGMVIGIQ